MDKSSAKKNPVVFMDFHEEIFRDIVGEFAEIFRNNLDF